MGFGFACEVNTIEQCETAVLALHSLGEGLAGKGRFGFAVEAAKGWIDVTHDVAGAFQLGHRHRRALQ